jgi:uncharacterized membrane protein
MTPPPATGIGKTRIETLADGVFAIAMTLLILDVRVPTVDPEQDAVAFARNLWHLWPRFLAFAVSFLIAGVFWVGHNAIMSYIVRSDRVFLWLNLVFLLFISAIPFSASLVGQYPQQPAAVWVYCSNLIIAGLFLFVQVHYAAGRGHLFDERMNPQLVKFGGRRILMGPAFYAAASLVAFLSPPLSLAVCAIVPLLYIMPGRVDRYWRPTDSALPETGEDSAPEP